MLDMEWYCEEFLKKGRSERLSVTAKKNICFVSAYLLHAPAALQQCAAADARDFHDSHENSQKMHSR